MSTKPREFLPVQPAAASGDGSDLPERDVGSGVALERPSGGDFEQLAFLTSDFVWMGRVFEDGRIIVDWSAPRARGYTVEELNTQPWQAVVYPDDIPVVADLMVQVRAGKPVSGEYRMVTPTGEVRYLRASFQPVAGGKTRRVTRFYGAARDITDETLAAQQVQETSDRYKAIFESRLAAIFIVDDEGRYVDANSAAFALLGYSRDELFQRSALDAMDVENRQAFFDAFRATGKVEGEIALVRKDGSPVRVEYYATANVVPGLHMAVMRDIGDRIRKEEALTLLELVVNASHDAIVSADVAGKITSWNPAAARLFGHTAAEAIGGVHASSVPSRHLEQFRAVRDRISRGEAVEYETERLRKDGSLVHVALTVAPIFDASGKRVGNTAVARDITDRIRKEEALSLLASVVHASHDAIVSTDLEGRVTSWTPSAERIFGYTEAEALGEAVTNYIPKDRIEEFKAIQEKVRAGETVDIETVRLRKDGTTIHIALTVAPILDASGKRIGNATVSRDITERKQAAEAASRLREDIEASVERRVSANPYGLTFRELTVLQLMARGQHDREIAEVLGISPRTVQNHVTSILARMSASSRTDASVRALREGLIE